MRGIIVYNCTYIKVYTVAKYMKVYEEYMKISYTQTAGLYEIDAIPSSVLNI